MIIIKKSPLVFFALTFSCDGGEEKKTNHLSIECKKPKTYRGNRANNVCTKPKLEHTPAEQQNQVISSLAVYDVC